MKVAEEIGPVLVLSDSTTERVQREPRSAPIEFGRRYRLSHCVLLLAFALLLMAGAAAESRSGSWTSGLLFWAAVITLFAAPAPFLVREKSGANRQAMAAILLGLSFEIARVVAFPIRFVQTDELAHLTTLNSIERTHHLFHANSLLPVGPWFPGLEVVTQAVQSIAGLSQFYAGYAVLCVAHVILALGILELVSRVAGSRRAGGIAVLVYAGSLQWYFFNAQFSYQSLALPLMVVGLSVLVRAVSAPRGGSRVSVAVLATALLVSTVFVHHLVSWITCVVLIVWSLVEVALRRRNSCWVLVAVTTVVTSATLLWIWFVGGVLTDYLGPIFRGDASGIWAFVTGAARARKLFTNTAGASSARWEVAIDVVSLALVVLLIPIALWDGRRWLREKNSIAIVLAAIGAAFPLLLITRFAPAAGESGDRATTFVYIGLALLFGAWMSRLVVRDRRYRVPIVIGLFLIYMGGIAGGNPDAERLPGPFLITADARSADSIALAPAYWLGKTFKPDTLNIAADFDDRNLMAAYGHQTPITNGGDDLQVKPIYTSTTITPFDRTLLNKGHIDLVVVDIRMSEYLPINGVYFEVGEPGGGHYTRPLPKAPLEKFNNVWGVSRIYDNGYVRIYDVRYLSKS